MTPHPSLSRHALFSLVLGLASFGLFLLAFTGLPALYLGLLALREINASEGTVRGRGLALAGMVLGGLASLITVIGVIALVLVEVNLNSQRTGCVDHLRRIGLGLHRYHEARNAFPPAGLPAPGLADEQRVSWLGGIAPFLGEGKSVRFFEDLGSRIHADHAWDDPINKTALQTPVRIFLCPASDQDPQQVPTPSSYVGLAGIDPGALDLPRTDPRAGVFGYDRGVKREEITSISRTLMAAETAQNNGPWLASGVPTARGVDPEVRQYVGPGRPFGGLHRGGMNALYADLSVPWVSDGVEPEVFRQAVLLRKWEER